MRTVVVQRTMSIWNCSIKEGGATCSAATTINPSIHSGESQTASPSIHNCHSISKPFQFLIRRQCKNQRLAKPNQQATQCSAMQTTSLIASASATRVNLGPLPTTFSPPSDCTSLRFINRNVVFMGAAIGYGCYEVRTSTMPCIAEDTNKPNKRDGVARCTLDIHGMGTVGGFCQSPPSTNPSEACMVMTSISHSDFSLTQSCYPPKFASFFTSTDYDIGKWASQPPIYSPGLACPPGYSPTCTIERIEGVTNSVTTTTATNADNIIWSMLNDGETAIGCCPS